MGKRYYCDYCDNTMVSSPSIVKTHNNGLPHKKLVLAHYQQYKDPETILAEESGKKPCTRFPIGECGFGTMCRYSHFSFEELNQLRDIVAQQRQKNINVHQPSFKDLYQKLQEEKHSEQKTNEDETVIYDKCGITHVFPWTYNRELEKYEGRLPPSIKKFTCEDFENVEFSSWGS